jgi:hypothetical protein
VRARPLIALIAALAVIASPANARADGDPASDILLQQDVYYPYAPKTSLLLRKALDGLLKRTRAAGYPLKVALIQTRSDLGSYPQMFSDPQRYANLLAQELATITHGRAKSQVHLLVVFPSGFAGSGLGTKVNEALAPVRVNAEAQADGLAQAALEASARLATANGHRTPIPPEAKVKLAASDKSTKRSGPPIIVFILPVLLVVGAALVAGRRAGRRDATAAGEDAAGTSET